MIRMAIFFSPSVDAKSAEAPWSLYQLMRASIQRESPQGPDKETHKEAGRTEGPTGKPIKQIRSVLNCVLVVGSKPMQKKLGHFLNDQTGATAIEYGLIAALIFLVIVSAVNLLSSETTNMYNKISSNVSNKL